jgi:hypothetical protein
MTDHDVLDALLCNDRPLLPDEVLRAVESSGVIPNSMERAAARDRAIAEAEARGAQAPPPDIPTGEPYAGRLRRSVLSRLQWLEGCGFAREAATGGWEADREACQEATSRGRVLLPPRHRPKAIHVLPEQEEVARLNVFEPPAPEADRVFIWEWCARLGDRPEAAVHELRGCRARCLGEREAE